jgi:NhaC family Na+:H+ antiporter
LEVKGEPRPRIIDSLISIGALIFVMAICLAVYHTDPHVPLLMGSLFASIIALKVGYKWKDIETGMMQGITQALQAIVILAIIGLLIGVWIKAGVVPSMIYYGLMVISPKFFLVATLLICSIVSLATGTSWGTIGTMGIALMGIGAGLGIPPAQTGGAIISGAYFGDKISPLSDTTNLAPAMAGTDLFTHIKHTLKVSAVSYPLAILIFLFLGMKYSSTNVDLSQIKSIQDALALQFSINPLLLLPPIIVIICIALKAPAIPGITIGIIAGAIAAVIFQDVNFGDIVNAGYSGYESISGNEMIDELLTAGGLTGMMYSISLTIIAMMFGGIMERTKQLEVLVDALLTKVKTTGNLVAATAGTCIASNMLLPEQYISIVLPGRMYANAYQKMGLHPKNLSRALECSGTVTSSLVPWNTCGAFIKGTLGISPFMYGPYAFFNILTVLTLIIFGYFNITMTRLDEEPETVLRLGQMTEE